MTYNNALQATRETHPPQRVSVQRAVICLWISAGLTAVLTALQLVDVIPTIDLGATAAIGLVTFALLAFVAERIRAGNGRARWLYLGLYILGSFGFLSTVSFALQAFLQLPILLQASCVLQFVLQTAALALLFTRESREWLAKPHAGSAPSAP